MMRAVWVGALLVASVTVAAALTNEEANRIKAGLLHGDLAYLSVPCPEGWRLKDSYDFMCAVALRILINDLEEKGHAWRSFCPKGVEYGSLYDTITDYIVAEKPHWSERASDVALRALKRRYPCH